MSKQKSSSREWLVAFIIAGLIAVIVRCFLFSPFTVSGQSMYPNFHGDEFIIVNQIVYKLHEPRYGEVVVFETEENGKEKDLIKRVIGVAGDKIEIIDGQVYRNDQPLDEQYINEPMLAKTMDPIDIEPGHIFVLGDNRNNSKDSRQIGAVSLDSVIGRAEVILFPFDSFGGVQTQTP
ncbi:signal peptidase I [Hazenella sp. IB182357]|uniref:Signal peptidase I n=1 Tax=Polycladospora coralii TaxID=2771432 RepID=A0A926NAH4_9BACL|nr:signal peptidase I [Polycladospora coralii]MBD1372477.1 signal peptidase I [Polycladospora coralii]MBS7531799.1 signal peptidase I [Polycladospora coralii]